MGRERDPTASGGAVLLAVVALGLACALTLLVCLLAVARRRRRAERQLRRLPRVLGPVRPPPPRFSTLPLPPARPPNPPGPAGVFPADLKFDARPPSYEEALRQPGASCAARPHSATLNLRTDGRTLSPPPAFAEVSEWAGRRDQGGSGQIRPGRHQEGSGAGCAL